MNNEKIGKLIYDLRTERKMTQQQLADHLHISNKTVSKWERGLGCPDISLLSSLSAFFEVDMEKILEGELSANDFVGGNMKKTKYYVCPICGNLTVCTGNAEISCCGRKLEALEPVKYVDGGASGIDGGASGKASMSGEASASAPVSVKVEVIEDDWFVTSDHPMTKDNYISFVAFATGDKLQIYKQYPEWDLQLRFPKRGHGMLLWYSTTLGLFYRLI